MLLSVLLASVVAVSAPTPGPSHPGKPGTPVTVTTSEYQFIAPAELPAGPTTFRLVNQGKLPHHVVIIRLDDGKTVADFEAASAHEGPPPTWAVPVGGPNAVDPGRSATATVDLSAGSYVMVCFIPAPDGKPHMAHGMVKAFTVTGGTEKAAPLPATSETATLADYGFTFSTPLHAGAQRVTVRNVAQQMHELVLVRLAPGKTGKDFLSWAEGGMKGPPPGSFQGGVSPIAPGVENVVDLNLQPGKYLLVCFLPDAKDGKPHLAHGMVQELTIN